MKYVKGEYILGSLNVHVKPATEGDEARKQEPHPDEDACGPRRDLTPASMDVDGVKNEEKPVLDIERDDAAHEEDPDEVMTISHGQGSHNFCEHRTPV